MNYENTKLDLSGYSESEREEITVAYMRACGKIIDCIPRNVTYLFNKNGDVSFVCVTRFMNFDNVELTELKPVKHKTWEPIKSVNDLKVGDVINYKLSSRVPFIGNNLTVVDIGGIDEPLHTHDLIKYKKLTITYTFEPVRDDIDLLAENMRDFNIKHVKATSTCSWEECDSKYYWRAMAKLAKEELLNEK